MNKILLFNKYLLYMYMYNILLHVHVHVLHVLHVQVLQTIILAFLNSQI